jgi:hypothetical protein
MAAGQSPYQAHAEGTMNWNRGDMKALIEKGDMEAKDLYALAKARVLGLGFGCAWRKFIVVAMAMAGLDITKDDPELVLCEDENGDAILDADGRQKVKSGYGTNSRRIVQEYRDANPKIVALWRSLDDSLRGSEGGDFEMTLPSGRTMRYGAIRSEWRTTVDEETGKTKRRLVYTALVGNRRTVIYGGLLTENLVQATARDVFAGHCLELAKTPGIDVLFTSHDETINECEPVVTVEDVEHIMSECPDWLRGCPIRAEGKKVAHYKK